jgi:GNAT superfamily N-acetyltransferase
VSLRFYTHDERPELSDRKGHLLDAWPSFMLEDEVSNRCWGLLYERFGAFQHFLVDTETDELVSEVNAVPVELDLDALPDRGWDEALEQGTTGTGSPTVVSAIQVLIAPDRQGQGLSKLCLERMRETAVAHGYEHLVAPVRPSLKDRYPLVPIERYIRWTRPDGQLLDPWLRVHAGLGAELIGPCRESMTVTGSVADWEEWTGMVFPDSGDYVVRGALELVRIDREADRGTYVEPNVWMHHRLR